MRIPGWIPRFLGRLRICSQGFATVDSRLWIRNCGFATVDSQLWIRNCGFATVDSRLWIRDWQIAAADCCASWVSRLIFEAELKRMQVTSSQDVALQRVEMEGAAKCQFRILIGNQESAPNFVMREFTVEPGGHTPRHFHNYEHEVYVLSGAGQVLDGEDWRDIRAGDVVFVAPNDVHQFRNSTDSELRFLCLIPSSATDQRVHPVPECGSE